MRISERARCGKRAEADGDCSDHGFTLVELMVVIAILGILAAIAIPNYIRYREKAKLASVVSDLDYFEKGFIAYAIDNGDYPDDTDIVLPPMMDQYINPGTWNMPTPLGGRYNWEGPDWYGYSGISLTGATAPQWKMKALDSMLDDGNLGTGKFRITPNDRYTYIIDE